MKNKSLETRLDNFKGKILVIGAVVLNSLVSGVNCGHSYKMITIDDCFEYEILNKTTNYNGEPAYSVHCCTNMISKSCGKYCDRDVCTNWEYIIVDKK